MGLETLLWHSQGGCTFARCRGDTEKALLAGSALICIPRCSLKGLDSSVPPPLLLHPCCSTSFSAAVTTASPGCTNTREHTPTEQSNISNHQLRSAYPLICTQVLFKPANYSAEAVSTTNTACVDSSSFSIRIVCTDLRRASYKLRYSTRFRSPLFDIVVRSLCFVTAASVRTLNTSSILEWHLYIHHQ